MTADPPPGTITVDVERSFNLEANRLWELVTCAAAAREWLGTEVVAAGESFTVERGGTDRGTIAVVGESALAIEFDGGSAAAVSVVPTDTEGCRVVVRESSVPRGHKDTVASWWSDALLIVDYVVGVAKRHADPAQAVVVVHGIGEQHPGSTIRGFAEALLGDEKYFSKPDWFSESYELRRLQALRTETRPRTDFFELYWAHQIRDTRLGQVTGWLKSILTRRPSTVPPQLRWAYRLLWTSVGALALGVVLLGIDRATSLSEDAGVLLNVLPSASIVIGVVGSAASAFLVASLGDAARYLSAHPDNVAVRQTIRTQGVELLRRLHESGRYHRIVVVGHSLGSVIAYDALCAYWADVHAAPPRRLVATQPALAALEAPTSFRVDDFQAAQRDLWAELRSMGHPWLVTDFVTCGSPLAHAQLLMTKDAAELAAKRRQRELAVCPPQLDFDPHGADTTDVPPARFSFERKVLIDRHFGQVRVLHHGAVFGPTRWTNLFFPVRFGLGGDPVGGPVAGPFSPAQDDPAPRGIKDVEVWTESLWRRRTPKSHSCYWRSTSTDTRESLESLRAAVGLDSRDWVREVRDDTPLSWWLPDDKTWW